MMVGNVNRSSVPGGVRVRESLGGTAEFRIYDALPPRLKELYDAMPMRMIPSEFKEFLDHFHGDEEAALAAIERNARQIFPEWKGPLLRRSK